MTCDDSSSSFTSAFTQQDKYPLSVIYCGNCSLPFEYCEYNSPEEFQRCLLWRRENYPELFSTYDESLLSDALKNVTVSESLTKAVENNNRSAKKKAPPSPEVVVTKAQRKGRKQVTIISGLDKAGVKLSEFSKVCKKQFSCGASVVTAPDMREVVEVQGDHLQETLVLLKDQFSVPGEYLYVMDDNKRKVHAF
ncbi:hypothetical protein GAYE_SCF46G5841 [Galdieria yellowstonensis]|uniref:SUI1 domain-containing protein n=1 Tax=Galdieria yellowstonensis TaxID=3028027 RepID=A0AAV9IKV3_9RHOD|nr:hypothetical protein GAYE_SCF46G5841 [Galdieria yellowstonensis]